MTGYTESNIFITFPYICICRMYVNNYAYWYRVRCL